MPVWMFLLVGSGLVWLAIVKPIFIPIALLFWIVLGRILFNKFHKPEKTSYEKMFDEIDNIIANAKRLKP